jgi:hypothetical protein
MTWFGWSIVELAEHLGYRPHASEGRGSRNRSYTKTVTTDVGPVEIDMPRDPPLGPLRASWHNVFEESGFDQITMGPAPGAVPDGSPDTPTGRTPTVTRR